MRRLLEAYPRIYFACHTRHVSDPRTKDVLSAHQASILSHLDSLEATSLLELAGHMGVTASTMSLGIERLVRSCYVRRRRSAEDARRVDLSLTAKGVRTRDAQSVLDPALVRALLGRLSPLERERALSGLELLSGAASAATEEWARRKATRRRLPGAGRGT
ncbi:winged helix-turn-helix transcriptional regulator [bacterium]|nr:winged helix-turn-helix transcriptional regulator [bacterium]